MIPPTRPAASRNRGLSLLELISAMAVAMVSSLAYLHSLAQSIRLSDVNRETAEGVQVLRDVIEGLKQDDFSTLFAAYNDATADDPPDAPGPHFDVDGLTPQPGDADGRVGRISFPVAREVRRIVTPGTLTEDPDTASPLMPRDLDLNGSADDADVSGSYLLLPVEVELRWRGRSGDQRLSLVTLLGDT